MGSYGCCNQNDLRLDDDNLLTLATKLLDESKHLLVANVSALGTGTVRGTVCYFFFLLLPLAIYSLAVIFSLILLILIVSYL